MIQFYHQNGPYGCFSNFSRHPITIDGKVWPTSEHYFQAQKFIGTHHETEVRNAPNPMTAANLGRDRSKPLRVDWEDVKLDVMRKALRAKFTQHKDLRLILIGTGNEELIEHTVNDKYWGDGGNGKGQNWLGRLLMELRASLLY